MVGKLDIGTDNGDYAFDIRAARATAEAAAGAAPGGISSPTPIGPYSSTEGAPYWFRTNPNTGKVQVGWDIDSDPDPDIWRRLTAFLNDGSVDLQYRLDVETQAYAQGWDGVS